MVDGPYAFLFTDIEGSTKLWEAMPEAMSSALIQHDAILRVAIQSNGGQVFKTVGDAFCAVFADPQQAVDASLAAQGKLASSEWGPTGELRVRMAIHFGYAERRDDDFFGPTLNRTARILGAGHGGQVLLSSSAIERLQGSVAWLDLGAHRLKDLGEPVQIGQLVHPSLREDFPPLATLRTERHNLPIQTSSFVGRGEQVRAIGDLLASHRLVTLVGPGGVGKTRLALQAAADAIDDFVDGAWYVDLQALTDAELVASECARVLAPIVGRPSPGVDGLIQALSNKQTLIVLDTCEHVLAGVVGLLTALLGGCRSVKVVATSREPLGVAGERTVRVPPLGVPPPTERRPECLAGYESVQLFCERATAAQQSFQLDSGTAPSVAHVCATLDGIPLAIELAAARTSALTVLEIDRRLDDRFRLLTKGRKDVLPRHQTLQALVDWSYNLLAEEEQAVLRHCATFAGGWTLAAAEAVCAEAVEDPWDVVDHLTSLVDKSLVQFDSHSGRYGLLQSVRAYALGKLEERGEARSALDAHSGYFAELAEKRADELTGNDPTEALDQLETEHDNLRQAFRTLLGDKARDPRFYGYCMTMGRFWELRGHLLEGYRNLKEAVGPALPEDGGAALSTCLNLLGNLARHLGKLDEAEPLYRVSLDLRRRAGDLGAVAGSLSNLATLAIYRGDLVDARSLITEAHDINAGLGQKAAQAVNLVVLGNVEAQAGDLNASCAAFSKARDLSLASGNRRALLYSVINLGLNHAKQKEWDPAGRYLSEALALCVELRERTIAADGFRFLGQTKLRQGQIDDALRAYASAERLREEIGVALPPCDQSEYDADLADLEAAIGGSYGEAWASARSDDWEDACRRLAPPRWFVDEPQPS